MAVTLASAVIGWVVAASVLLALVYRRALVIAWREPTLRAPVLILESDDWGYGPPLQAARLDRIADLLCGFRDARGRHPMMTLGIVLGGPDVDTMRRDGAATYQRLTIDDARLAPVLDAMTRGAARGVFALQLHGLEHYWPACLLRSARDDAAISAWLTAQELPRTEALPPALQSRWIDAVRLPSTSLPVSEVTAAAVDEVRVFTKVFGIRPEVAVPPTFVWTRDVESAWANAGVRVVVTPGRRSESRGQDGAMIYCPDEVFNGAIAPSGVSYVVRNNYFEPMLGHTHTRVLEDLKRNTRLGRPTLVEMHRSNFIGDDQMAERAFEESTRMLSAVRAAFPHIRFMSTGELATSYRNRSDLLEDSLKTRFHVCLARLAGISRLRKLAWLTGAIGPAWLAYAASAPRPSGESLR